MTKRIQSWITMRVSKVIVRMVIDDFKSNGPLRQMILSEMK